MEFNKNSIIGLVLMLALAFGVSWYNAKTAQEEAEQQALALANQPKEVKTTSPKQDSTSNAPAQASPSTLPSDAIEKYGVFGAQVFEKPGQSVLENDKIKVVINHKGANIQDVTLKSEAYKTYWGKKDIQLFDPAQNQMNWVWKDKNKGEQGSWRFVFKANQIVKDERGNQSLTLVLADSTE